jgi:hypothetical protein
MRAETRWLSILAAVALTANVVAVGDAHPIDVTASELAATYRADAASASASYHGVPLRVSGTVSRIGPQYVVVGDVHCAPAGAESLEALAPGDWVTLRGLGASYILGSPVVHHCEIER